MKAFDNLSATYCFERATLLAPDFMLAHIRQAEIFHLLENYDKEIQHLEQALHYHPGHFDIYYPLARAYKEKGASDEALQYYHLAYQHGDASREEYFETMYEIIEINDKNKDYALALDMCWAYLHQRPFERKLMAKTLKLIEELGKRNELTYFGQQIDHKQFSKHLVDYLRERADGSEQQLAVAQGYFLIGDGQAAWVELTHVLGSTSSGNSVYQLMNELNIPGTTDFYTALWNLRMERYEYAADFLTKVINVYPEDGEAQYYLALAHYNLSKIQFELDLDRQQPISLLQSSLKACLTALFLGMDQPRVQELSGDIKRLYGRIDANFFWPALAHYTEAYHETGSLALLKKIVETEIETTTLDMLVLNEEAAFELVSLTKRTIIDDIVSKTTFLKNERERMMIRDLIGDIVLRLLKAYKQLASREMFCSAQVESLFKVAEHALKSVVHANDQGYEPSLRLADLYWEWLEIVERPEQRKQLLQQAIASWEHAQHLTRTVVLAREDRTVREKAEIMIGRALKQLRVLYDK
jgi:tetratricopeptide (TPR) repeat protein